MLKENIWTPKYIKKGVMKNDLGYHQDINIMGGDTETNIKGKPYLLCLQVHGQEPNIIECDEHTSEQIFIEWLYDNSRSYKNNYAPNVIYFHNLLFDLSAIFNKHHRKFGFKEFFIEGSIGEISYLINLKVDDCVFGNIYFFKDELSYGKRKERRGIIKKIELRDSFHIFMGRLKKVANDLKLDHRKADKPKSLEFVESDLSSVTPKDRKELLEYAKQDVLVQTDLAKHIMDLHKEYDIRLCVSIAQMSSRIFKHHFMNDEDCLTFPENYVCQRFAELSYHGGKNGFYLDKPQIIKDVYEIDVVSMYPYAMTKIPNFNHCEYVYAEEYEPKFEGVYKVSGFVEDSKYPIIPRHEFTGENYFRDEYINDICVTSYELRQGLKDGLFSMDDCLGYVVKEDKSYHNPLKEYAEHFFNKKSKLSKDDVSYHSTKLFANSIYGKFQQLTEQYDKSVLKGMKEKPHKIFEVDVDNQKVQEFPTFFKAGGLYSPMISTLITGFGRAYLYQLETKYDAFDSSTDSIKTLIKPKHVGKGLGDLDVKNFGDCLFIRGKFYVHFGEEITYAKHGCQASLEDILKMWITKTNDYEFERFVKVRESLRIPDRIPLTKQKFKGSINIDWSDEYLSPKTLLKAKKEMLKYNKEKDDLIDDAFIDSTLSEDELKQPKLKDLY